jgi:hypothetical protein
MSSRVLIGIIGAAVLGLGLIVAFLVGSSVSDASSREYRIVIPEGTGDLIAAGNDPGVIPSEIQLTLDEQDILVIENHDHVGHRISDFWVGAGETLRQEFHTPATYQGECTVHESAQIQIIVNEPR